ncbi:MAG TPA: tRNA (adenosine(37)-N6)-threonylcarbamoyltransferase complex dimerization subunit type 1 TsaB [Gemmatimonadaceae bacterium]|nr:tRNA (adenosine(37)-N6)-threonylcarbamoyltransferase complex dimerization subunit type 1 TsaB [Gemmatimonadaceae bacterium]
MITLALDASTYEGDVAVVDGARVLADGHTAMKRADRETLMPLVGETLQRAAITPRAIDRVICGAGPGSFTSLRIAASIAKGLTLGLGKPLFAVPSLALVVGGARLPSGRYVAALDALRGEVYVALYDVHAAGDVIEVERARLIPASDLERLAADSEARIVTPLQIDGAIRARPMARGVVHLAAWIRDHGAVDATSWEPSYGRLAEAQVRWESAHGTPLPTA